MYTTIFDEFKVPKNDLIFIYRLLFQLINLPDIHQDLNNAEYWRRVVVYLRSESKGKVGTMLHDIAPKLDFSEINLFSLLKMTENNLKKLIPANYSKICGSTGFIVFYLKDAFEYSGVIEEKKLLLKLF